MDGATSRLLHATAISVDGRAALIRGPSGAGKSDLALRAMTSIVRDGDRTLCASLVADDQVVLEITTDGLVVGTPPTIAGRIEVRGVGILSMDHVPRSELYLVVDLAPGAIIDRMPEPAVVVLEGWAVPVLGLHPFLASAVAKMLLALARAERPYRVHTVRMYD